METLLVIVIALILIGVILTLILFKYGKCISLNTGKAERTENNMLPDHRSTAILRQGQKCSHKKKMEEGYESLFIKKPPVIGRKEKNTYLRSEFHKRIQNIILCYDKPNLSVFGYIDTVLAHHFEIYEQDIKEILKRRIDE